jgi:RNA polymerase sigma factor (sigma-70 family)
MTTQRTNREWIDGIANDDREAYYDLFDILRRFAWGYVNSTMYYRDDAIKGTWEATVDDCTQEAIISVRKNIAQYTPSVCRFTSWAYAVVKNKLVDALRKNKRDLYFGAPEEIQRAATYYYDDADMFQLAELKDIIDNHLTDKQRTVLLMWLDDYSDDEIALALGSNANAVYKVRFDTRTKIIDLIGRRQ